MAKRAAAKKSIVTAADVFKHFKLTYDPKKSLKENDVLLNDKIHGSTGAGTSAHLVQTESGLEFQSMCYEEATDTLIYAPHVKLPCTPADLEAALDYLEDESQRLWELGTREEV